MTMLRTTLTLLFAFVAFYQSKSQDMYKSRWTRIDSLMQQQGLTETAGREIDALLKTARAAKNQAQVIKALQYKASIDLQKNEEAQETSIRRYETELKTAAQPGKSVIQSILAVTYWNYLQQNRFRLYQAGNAPSNPDDKDLSTWSLKQLNARVRALYLASIEEVEILRNTPLEKFDAIIEKGDVRKLRPSLYDLLAFRAIDYFRNDEASISRAADIFRVSDKTFFAPAKEFVKIALPIKDSASAAYQAIRIYQQVLRLHSNDKDLSAYIDADVSRLEYVREKSTLANSEQLYLEALQQVASTYASHPASDQALFLIASSYAQRAGAYDPAGDTSNRYHYIKALAIANQIIALNRKSEGYTNAVNLRNSILVTTLTHQVEAVNVPGKPFRALVEYRNASILHYRIIRLDQQSDDIEADPWEPAFWTSMVGKKTLVQQSVALPATNDHQAHRVEIAINSLPPGEYGMLTSATPGFEVNDKNPLALARFSVSSISYMQSRNDVYVLDRVSGKPLSGVVATVYTAVRKGDKVTWTKSANYNTDNLGKFTIHTEARDYSQKQLEFQLGNDKLRSEYERRYYSYNNGVEQQVAGNTDYERANTSAYLFTDRSIYRPGQETFFKAIFITKEAGTKKPKLVTGLSTTIYLVDANGQRKDSLSMSTNEYGSVHGSFRLPLNLLNGMFSLEDKATGSATAIRVEEYKRPKFKVELKPPAGTYRVNDSIRVKGAATAFAGNSISGARLNYTVIRRTVLPYQIEGWFTGKIWPPRRNEETVITTGSLITNSSGEFTISFTALPDPEVKSTMYPIFNYEVQADVVDINGESHSATRSVAAGYQSIQIDMETMSSISEDSLRTLTIRTTNLNGIFEKAMLKISFNRLQSPPTVYRSRYWQRPDQFIYSEEEFHTLFPTDEYKAEADLSTWKKTKETITVSDSSSPSGNIPLTQKIREGVYELEVVAISAAGDTVRRTQFIRVNGKEPQLGAAYVDLSTNKQAPGLNEPISVKVETNLGDLFLLKQMTINDKLLPANGTPFNKRLEEETAISEYGQARIDIAFVKDNRFYTQSADIYIVDQKKSLDISLASFRNKVLPGSKESWKIRVAGMKGEKAAASLLTGMYDASLDQFVPHQWTIPFLASNVLDGAFFFADGNFRVSNLQQKYNPTPIDQPYEKVYDQLSELPEFNNQMSTRIRGVASAAPAAQAAGEKDVVVSALGRSKESKQVGYTDTNDTAATRSNEPVTAQYRKDFRETAFFFPSLSTDAEGNTEINFTMPEAMTTWKWMTLAYTTDLAFGYKEQSVLSQKEFMVQPNLPRFLREGDRIDLSTKIVNMGAKELTGQVELQLIDPETNQSVDGWFRNVFPNQYFTAAAGESVVASFSLEVPYQYAKPVIYRFIARSDSISDGEEGILPVLLSKVMVTETVALPLLNEKQKQVKLPKLLNSGSSETLSTQSLTIEFTSNPSWLAVQALPALAEIRDGSSEQVFNQLYAGALTRKVFESNPAIAAWYSKYKMSDSSARSRLEQNETLKAILLQQTPWVLDAKNETDNIERIASMFQFWSVQQHLLDAVIALESLQRADGSFSWMNGGPADRFITQNILTGIGRLIHMQALNAELNKRMLVIVSRGMDYVDQQLRKEYDQQKKLKSAASTISALQVQYLYMRSLFPTMPVAGKTFAAYNAYRKIAASAWVKSSRQLQGMTALALGRTGDRMNANRIIRSLKENALRSTEMGMYWKTSNSGYEWYSSDISTQAILIEAFAELTKDSASIEQMKAWLIKHKQTNSWRGDKATADACYALLMTGSNWLASNPQVEIQLGTTKLNVGNTADSADTGYFIKTFEAQKVKPEMGDIQVFVKTPSVKQPMFGAVYWKYTEDLDKITQANTPVKLTRRLFIQKQMSSGVMLEPVLENSTLHPGDRLTVKIDIRADRTMEYVHVSDMRASGLEPVNTLSGYNWNTGLGVYQVTRDASTDFYIDHLTKGTYSLTYDLVVNNSGSFTTGISTVQCLYSPEFTGHTAGLRFHAEPE